MEQLITIELFGQPYTFKTESGAINAKEVADYLLKEVTRVEDQQSSQSSNITKIATLILAALNIATDNIEQKKIHSDQLRDISKRSENLIRILDAAANG